MLVVSTTSPSLLITILGYSFLVIFILTALLTLASLPGWIKIPDKYRSQLFKALLLEVVGAIIILFGSAYLNRSNTVTTIPDVTISPNKNSWIALDKTSFKTIQPSYQIDSTKLPIPMGIPPTDASNKLSKQQLSIQLNEDRYSILNETSKQQFGFIPKATLEKKFFSGIELPEDGYIYKKSIKKISFNKAQGSTKWIPDNGLGDPSILVSLRDTHKGTMYKIETQTSSGLKTIFDLNEVIKEEINDYYNVNQRGKHIFNHNQNYYLFYVHSAILTPGIDNNLTFRLIKLEPKLE